ncbi:hypothetical protein FKP32DRAFT_52796 [Trametes sanguinea]|nr:hypothetical protein FKP32DRAFT_52796 [Trametes sanguinea]
MPPSGAVGHIAIGPAARLTHPSADSSSSLHLPISILRNFCSITSYIPIHASIHPSNSRYPATPPAIPSLSHRPAETSPPTQPLLSSSAHPFHLTVPNKRVLISFSRVHSHAPRRHLGSCSGALAKRLLTPCHPCPGSPPSNVSILGISDRPILAARALSSARPFAPS